MPVYASVSLHAGMGVYLVRSHARSFDESVDVSRYSPGWKAAISWDLPLMQSLRFGSKLKWYGACEFGDGVVAVQLQIPLVLHRW